MKWRLGASIPPLFTGQYRRNISRAISAKPRHTLLNGNGYIDRTMASLRLQGIDCLKQSLHSFVVEEDDFSELGSPVTHGAGKLLKLVTEKPERHGGRTSPAVRLKIENHNDGSRYTVNSKNASNLTNLSSITIKDVPSTVDPSQLIEAISVFGKVSSASMRTAPNGLNCCDIEFETVESTRRAVSVGEITVRSFHLPIHPLHLPETVTIRIKNISNVTADPAIHSICMSFGSLEGLARTKENAVDALYRVKDNLDLQSILKKLNGSTIDDCKWSAYLLPGYSSPIVMTNNEDAKCKLGLKISSHLAELTSQVCMKKIVTEDLGYLHSAILHLEETPGFSNPSS